MSMHDELVSLYGGGKVDEVEASDGFNDLRRRYSDVQGFVTEQNHVRQLRGKLQELLAEQRPETQVKLCLKLLFQTKQDDKRDEYHRLIKLAYWPHWSPAQQTHLDNAYAVITGDVYYFLSFTKHNMTPGNINIVNRNHRHLIEDVFYPKKGEAIGDYTEENLVAKVVWYFLESDGLKGFYYPLHQGNNVVVGRKLFDNLNITLTFVQIVHRAIFEKLPSNNYCFMEYENVCKSPQCRKRFVVLAENREDLKGGILPHDQFDSWRAEAIDENDALELKPTAEFSDSDIRENRKRIREKLVKTIRNIHTEMFERVPP